MIAHLTQAIDEETLSSTTEGCTTFPCSKADDGTTATKASTTGHLSPDPVLIKEEKARLEQYEYIETCRRDSLCSVQGSSVVPEESVGGNSSIGLRTAMISEAQTATPNREAGTNVLEIVAQLEKRNAAISSTFAEMVKTLVKTVDEQREIIEKQSSSPKQKRRWSMSYEKRQAQVHSCQVVANAMSDKQKELFSRVIRIVGELDATVQEKSADNRRLSYHLNVIKSTMKKLRTSKKKRNEKGKRRGSLDHFLQENNQPVVPQLTAEEPSVSPFSICQITCTSTVVDVNELSQRVDGGHSSMQELFHMADDEAVRLMV